MGKGTTTFTASHHCAIRGVTWLGADAFYHRLAGDQGQLPSPAWVTSPHL